MGSLFVPSNPLSRQYVNRLIGIGGGCWGLGGRHPRGPYLLAIPQNVPIPKFPKMPPKIRQNIPKYLKHLKIPQNTTQYVLQNYRGVRWRANLPPKPISLYANQSTLRSVYYYFLFMGLNPLSRRYANQATLRAVLFFPLSLSIVFAKARDFIYFETSFRFLGKTLMCRR